MIRVPDLPDKLGNPFFPRQALFRAGDATGCGQLYRIIALLVPSLRQS